MRAASEALPMDERVQRIFQRNELRRITLPRVLEALHVSDSQFKRKLQERGTSFREMLETERLRATRRMMNDGELRANVIAEAVGFQNPGSFCLAFQRWTGMTFTKYRIAKKANGGIY